MPGLGDEAFLAETEGSAGLKLRVGTYQGQINLSVEDRDPASVVRERNNKYLGEGLKAYEQARSDGQSPGHPMKGQRS